MSHIKERQDALEPGRIATAEREFRKLGYDVTCLEGLRALEIYHMGERVVYYPYSGWATGKTIKDGRGLKNLLRQLKNA